MTRPNGVNTNYTYDNLSRLLSVLHQLSGNTIDGATYTVDAVGNRTAKTNHLNSEVTSYTYDAVYQLTQAVVDSQTTEIYTYDAVGNRLSSLGVSPYSYNSSNQLTSTPSATFTYDDNGNTLSKTEGTDVTDYEWDFENRLVSVTLPNESVVSFKYDPLGRRIHKASPSGVENYIYDEISVIQEVDVNGAVVGRYTQNLTVDEPLAVLRDASNYYFEMDGLGSVSSLTNNAGAISATYVYDSFGRLAASTGTSFNPVRYTGREIDTETELYNYRARYYDALTGRFTGEDFLAFETNPNGNFYLYTVNNPINFIDPFGLDSDPAGKIQRLMELVQEHEKKIAKNPGSRDVEHWKKEIEGWKKQIRDTAKRVCKKRPPGSEEKYLRRILGGAAKRLLGLPLMIIINPCLVDPSLPGCPAAFECGKDPCVT